MKIKCKIWTYYYKCPFWVCTEKIFWKTMKASWLILQNIFYQKHQFCEILLNISISAQDKSQHKSSLDFREEFQQPNNYCVCRCHFVLMLKSFASELSTFQVLLSIQTHIIKSEQCTSYENSPWEFRDGLNNVYPSTKYVDNPQVLSVFRRALLLVWPLEAVRVLCFPSSPTLGQPTWQVFLTCMVHSLCPQTCTNKFNMTVSETKCPPVKMLYFAFKAGSAFILMTGTQIEFSSAIQRELIFFFNVKMKGSAKWDF